MTNILFRRTIPVTPRPSNDFSQQGAKVYRTLLQFHFPKLSPHSKNGTDRFGIDLYFKIAAEETKRHPKRDLDNLIKAVLDACQGFFWRDDSQVDEINARIERYATKSSVRIIIKRLSDGNKNNKELTAEEAVS
jgi:Holliday junction resolvase RusA-like endonuclease